MPDDVVQLMGEAQPLLVKAMLQQSRTFAFGLLGDDSREFLAGPDRVPRRQRAQHQGHVRHRLGRLITARAGDQHARRHDWRHQGADDQRAEPVPVEPHRENEQHHNAGRGLVGMEHGQTHQQQRHDNGQHAERVATAHRQRHGGQQGETRRERRQLLHLMADDRIDEQCGKGGERQHHIKIWPAQQPPQRGAHTRGHLDHHPVLLLFAGQHARTPL